MAPAKAAYEAIVDIIKEELEVNLGDLIKSGSRDGFLIIIIDEVGICEDMKWVDTIKNLNGITKYLQEKICKKVQLVLAGTGLDRITSSFNSDIDVSKIRMKEWGVDDLAWLVDKVSFDPTEKDVVFDCHTKISSDIPEL